MQKQINHNFWRQNFAVLLAMVFLIFGTSIHIPIAEALAHQPFEKSQQHCDFTIETEETIEENEEVCSDVHTQIQSSVRKSQDEFIFQLRCFSYANKLLNKAKATMPLRRIFMDMLLATGRIHSILPG